MVACVVLGLTKQRSPGVQTKSEKQSMYHAWECAHVSGEQSQSFFIVHSAEKCSFRDLEAIGVQDWELNLTVKRLRGHRSQRICLWLTTAPDSAGSLSTEPLARPARDVE